MAYQSIRSPVHHHLTLLNANGSREITPENGNRPLSKKNAPVGNDAIPDKANRKAIVRDRNVLSAISERELLSS
jgi:hypothetical protein